MISTIVVLLIQDNMQISMPTQPSYNCQKTIACEQKRIGNQFYIYDPGVIGNFDDLSFDSAEYARRNCIIGFAEGRGATFFVEHNGNRLVLRHYRRGGFVARYVSDTYLWLGLKKTRAWREWRLLEHMLACKLPVPRPVAAHVCRHGLTYQADIIVEKIDNAKSFASVLLQGKLSAEYWEALGDVIRRFHSAGIYHADLNASNIMLDAGGRFYLIDFDRGRRIKHAGAWQNTVLKRLHRSLVKYKTNNPHFNFEHSDWMHLLSGHNRIII